MRRSAPDSDASGESSSGPTPSPGGSTTGSSLEDEDVNDTPQVLPPIAREEEEEEEDNILSSEEEEGKKDQFLWKFGGNENITERSGGNFIQPFGPTFSLKLDKDIFFFKYYFSEVYC